MLRDDPGINVTKAHDPVMAHMSSAPGVTATCVLNEVRFIRRISAVSTSIQLSAAEIRQLIQTSNFCRI